MMSTTGDKVRCSINRQWHVDGKAVHSWCEAPIHPKPVALFSAEEERAHDKEHSCRS